MTERIELTELTELAELTELDKLNELSELHELNCEDGGCPDLLHEAMIALIALISRAIIAPLGWHT